MADASYVQSSFLGGEWSPLAQGRIDLPTYRTAMNVCLNGLPLEAGPWTRRPGTRLAAPTRNGNAGKLTKFDFQADTAYNIEFTDGYLRFFKGAVLAKTNDAQTVNAISTANPAAITTTAAHGWATGDVVEFAALGVACPALQNRQVRITKTGATSFTLADAITGTSVDGATFTLPTPAPTVSRVLEIASPYTSSLWASTRTIQTDTSAVMLNSVISPRILTVTGQPSVTRDATFSLNPLTFKDGPYLDPVGFGARVTPSGLGGVVNLTISYTPWISGKAYSVGDFVLYNSVNYVSVADANQGVIPGTNSAFWVTTTPNAAVGSDGFQVTDIGRAIRLYSEPAQWDRTAAYTAGNVVKYNELTYTCLATDIGSDPPLLPARWALTNPNDMWTWGRITGLTNIIDRALAGSVTFSNMQNAGAIFDGNTSNTTSTGAVLNIAMDPLPLPSTPVEVSVYFGKNYSGASAQKIQQATVYPTIDKGFGVYNVANAFNAPAHISAFALNGYKGLLLTFNLRGKATAPASASDGTLLGSAFVSDASSPAPISISSNDTSTAWNYVWVELVADLNLVDWTTPDPWNISLFVSELQFLSPVGTGSSSGVTFQIIGPTLLYFGAIRTWRLGAYSATTGWPTCGTFADGRLWLSGAIPNRVDATRSGNGGLGFSSTVLDFTPTATVGTVSDSNAISATFNAPDVSNVLWMIPDQQGIICGTLKGEWLIPAAATPTTIQAHRVTRICCANVEPQRGEHTLLFVQQRGRKVMEYFADVYSGKFSAPNLSEHAKHLTVSGISEIAYQQELSPILWARCGNGSLIGVTYKRDSLLSAQGPTFAGWHRHTLGSGRIVESIAVGPADTGSLGALSVVTNDPTTGIRYVEVMTSIPDETTTGSTAWFLDSAVTPTMAQYVTIAGVDCLQLGGLWTHNGKTVSVWAGQLDCGDHVVSNGIVNVPFGTSNALFTRAFMDAYTGSNPILAAVPIVVGFTYTSDGQIVRPATQPETGARNGPGLGKKRRSHQFTALLAGAQKMSFGTKFAALNAASFTTEPDGGNTLPITTLKYGMHTSTLTDDNGYDSMICWRVTRPYPASVAAMTGFLNTKDQ